MSPQPPEERRARADLPGMTLEIVHRAAGAGQPETIGLLIKGAPDLPAIGFDPMALWLEAQRQLWAPWLAMWGLAAPPKIDRR
jgi:hypothetical protein